MINQEKMRESRDIVGLRVRALNEITHRVPAGTKGTCRYRCSVVQLIVVDWDNGAKIWAPPKDVEFLPRTAEEGQEP